jgi:hypothetical protein
MAGFTKDLTESFELDPAHDIRNVHGAPGWTELSTPDPAAAREFLEAVFGWSFQSMDLGGGEYLVIQTSGHGVGGIRSPQPGEGPGAAWSTYISVEDVEETVRLAEQAGGNVLVPPTDLPEVGRMAGFEHPAAGRLLAFEYLRPFE